MSFVLLEFQGGEICQRGVRYCQGGRDFVKGGQSPPLRPPPPLNEALTVHENTIIPDPDLELNPHVNNST